MMTGSFAFPSGEGGLLQGQGPGRRSDEVVSARDPLTR